jgi:hypothetical protein
MKKMLWLIAILFLSPTQVLFAAEPDGVVIAHYEALEGLSLRRGALGEPEPVRMRFDAFGRKFVLALQSNERLITRVFRGQVPDGIDVYRGRLADRDDSWVRLVVSNGVPVGLVWDGKEMLAIESGSGTGSAIIYRLRDVYVEPGTLSCAALGKTTDFATVYGDITAELREAVVNKVGATKELNIGLIADYEFTSNMGANVETELLARINNVDGIFSEQLGVQLTAREIQTFSDPDDPFTSSASAELLSELSIHRLETPAQNAQGMTFMFTGRSLDGSMAGIAYTDSLCTRFGVGLAEGLRGVTTDSLIAAHEIGHIFGAPHDGEAGSDCEAVTGAFLMAPRLNGSDQFSSCSLDIIQPLVEAASCINPLSQADVSVDVVGSVPALLLGDSVNLEFDITNNGPNEAVNVTASFDIPTNLSLTLISASVGSCSNDAGEVSCTLGTIAGMESERVTLAVTADAVGTGNLGASVTADADANADNNTQMLQVVVDPVVDLRIQSGTGASVVINNTVTVRPTVENASAVAATNVEMSVSFSSGLRVDGASWAGGTCEVSGGTVSCQRDSIAAQSQDTIELQLTATSVGSQSYTAAVSSSEFDLDESNNSATGTVTVSAASDNPDEPSSGGGGALGLLGLVLLSLLRLSLFGCYCISGRRPF